MKLKTIRNLGVLALVTVTAWPETLKIRNKKIL